MKTQFSRVRRYLLLAGVLCTMVPLHVSAASGRQIEEVIVTAERKEASVQDTSISITAFTGEMLDDFGIRNQEDLQNFIPATTIQPYDATVRGVGRNFRALGGDPGVATYINAVYSEDLLTATAATFWDVERIEVLRGPQGTLYGRNAVGGAINILYKEPHEEFDFGLKTIIGDYGTEEYYGMINGTLVPGKLTGRFNFALRDRDGVIDEIGPTREDLDGLGTENYAALLQFTPTDSITVDLRYNEMDIDRNFGGANGGGLVVLNESGVGQRNTTELVGGFRVIDPTNTDPANFAQNNYVDPTRPITSFTNPATGAVVQAQPNRIGLDPFDGDGFRNAAASLDGFGVTSAASAALYNSCVFDGDIEGDDVCAATNGLNREQFDQEGLQFAISWDVSDALQLKYIYGSNTLVYQRITDDDNTGSLFQDRQFYVNHEADYSSHELQAFFDVSDTLSFTSGIFFYDAEIDQRGDFFSSVGEARYINAYQDNTGLAPAFFGTGEPTLHSARDRCFDPATATPSCAVNFASDNPAPTANNNLHIGPWRGDDGSNGDLNVSHGINTLGSDLLYHTETVREAFAAYTQGVWDINETFTLTFGIRYAEDDLESEENLFRYIEAASGPLIGIVGDLFTYNLANGGFVADATAPNGFRATELAVNGGIPAAVSVYRAFERRDTEVTGRLNLDYNLNDDILLYLSATTGTRSGGNNLVFFSATPDYDPEELTAYELGYKMQLLEGKMQLNGSFYYYDYESIHTTATEVTPALVPGGAAGTTTSVLAAPGAEIFGAEAEVTWFVTERLGLGGNFSWTPSEYSEDLFIADPAQVGTPESLFATDVQALTQNINGNQLLQVPELKYTVWGSYAFPLDGGSKLEFFGVYNYIDEVFYSPFESDAEKADAYDRFDLRATWSSSERNWIVSAFVNNVFDDVGVLQVLREGEPQFFRHSAGTTLPRLYGLEVTYSLSGNN